MLTCGAVPCCHVPRAIQLLAWADAMSQQQLFGVLLVMADSYHPHIASFQLLLDCLLLKQLLPQPADSNSSEATPLQGLPVQLLRASLHDQYSVQETCAAAIVRAMLSLPPKTHPGRCPKCTCSAVGIVVWLVLQALDRR